MARVIGVVNGKGGVGKTTTSVNLASIFARRQRVLVIDTDPQKSATWWADQGDMPFDLAADEDPKLLAQLRAIADYDLVFVDTPPRIDSASLLAVVKGSDYLVLPTRPAPLDVTALIDTIQGIVAPSNVPYRVLLTVVDPRSRGEAENALELFRAASVECFKGYIRGYQAHSRAPAEGVPITDSKAPNAGLGAIDYKAIAKEMKGDWDE